LGNAPVVFLQLFPIVVAARNDLRDGLRRDPVNRPLAPERKPRTARTQPLFKG